MNDWRIISTARLEGHYCPYRRHYYGLLVHALVATPDRSLDRSLRPSTVLSAYVAGRRVTKLLFCLLANSGDATEPPDAHYILVYSSGIKVYWYSTPFGMHLRLVNVQVSLILEFFRPAGRVCVDSREASGVGAGARPGGRRRR